MHKNILFPVDMEHTAEAEKALKIAVEEANDYYYGRTGFRDTPGCFFLR